MLELVYLSLLFMAAILTKYAIIDRRAEGFASLAAGLLFAVLIFASFSVRPTFSPEDRYVLAPMAWVAAGGTLLNLTIFILWAVSALPRATNESPTPQPND